MQQITDNLLEISKELNIDQKFVNKYGKFVINQDKYLKYTEVDDWIGYKKKETVLDILKNKKYGFIEGEQADYYIKQSESTGGRKANEIFMTIDTVKSICLMAPT